MEVDVDAVQTLRIGTQLARRHLPLNGTAPFVLQFYCQRLSVHGTCLLWLNTALTAPANA